MIQEFWYFPSGVWCFIVHWRSEKLRYEWSNHHYRAEQLLDGGGSCRRGSDSVPETEIGPFVLGREDAEKVSQVFFKLRSTLRNDYVGHSHTDHAYNSTLQTFITIVIKYVYFCTNTNPIFQQFKNILFLLLLEKSFTLFYNIRSLGAMSPLQVV